MNAPPSSPLEVAYCYPVSSSQLDLWLQDRFRVNTVQNVGRAWRVDGPIDLEALEVALSLVAERQSNLRSRFHQGVDGPEMHVFPNARLALERLTLQRDPNDAFAGEQQISAFLHHRFSLTGGPLARCAFLSDGDACGVFAVSMHHAISDGWSLGLFCREISEAYDRVRGGNTASLPELEVEYGDFAAFERGELQRGAMDEARAYWRRALSDPPTLPSIFRSREGMREPKAATSLTFTLPRDVVQRIDATAVASGVTRFAALLAIYRLTLAVEFGHRDVVVGTPAAARTKAELEPVVGFFATALPLRDRVDDSKDVRSFVREVHATVLDAIEHCAFPTLEMVKDAAPDRVDASHPLFKTWFAYHSYQSEPPEFGACVVAALPTKRAMATHEIALDLVPEGEEIVATAAAPASADADRGLQSFAASYVTLARLLEPSARVGDVIAAVAPPAPSQDVAGVLARIADAVRRHPRKVAVSAGADTLTYEALWSAASQVAQGLGRRGVRPGDAVGVQVRRSERLAALLLGVWLCGAHYVPLDPLHPQARNDVALAEAGARVVLVDQEGADGAICPAVHVDVLRGEAPEDRSATTLPATTLAACAYTMFTSGSTGRPKGVQISHEALAHFSQCFAPLVGLTDSDVVLATTTICFDISILELIVPLTVGASVVVARTEDVQRPDRLCGLVEAVGPTLFQATPTMWRLLLAAGWRGSRNLRAVCGGEALPWDLADQLIDRTRSLLNVYGPTEATIWCSTFDLAFATAGHRTQPYVPIGRPILGVEFQVAQTQDAGEHYGELLIGGPVLALGYCGDPLRTADRFGPFLASPTRYYRSGDMVRRDPDGIYCFSGRVDDQVKVRGHRIELGEVDAALLKHPQIREAATIAPVGPSGDRALRAFFVAEVELSSRALRAHLERLLPDYLIPETFQAVAAMPLSPNGKLDRGRLAAASEGRAVPRPAAPSARPSETQGVLALWRELLGQPDIPAKANFFALGGHSVLVLQMHNRIRETFGVELPLSEIYDDPTVEAIAERIYANGRADVGVAPERPSAPAAGVSAGAVSQSQAADLRLSEGNGSDPHAHIAFALNISGRLDREALRAAIALVVQRHDALRASFRRDGSDLQMLVRDQVDCPLEDLEPVGEGRDARHDDAVREIRARIGQGISPWRAPLVRVSCSTIETDVHIVSFAFHHTIVDGWSIGVLLREIASAYRQIQLGGQIVLPPVQAQMGDFTAWERQYTASERCRDSVEYWRSLFQRTPILRQQAAEGARRGSSRQLRFHIEGALLKPLQRVLSERRTTPFMASMTAWHRAMQHVEGTGGRVYRVPASNRQHAAWNGLVGALWNAPLIPLPAFEGPEGLGDLILVRDLLVASAPHMDVPVQTLSEALAPYLDADPALNIGLYNHRLDADFAIPGAVVDLLDLGPSDPSGNIDLRLWSEEQGLEGRVTYLDALYDEATVQSLVAAFTSRLLALGQS